MNNTQQAIIETLSTSCSKSDLVDAMSIEYPKIAERTITNNLTILSKEKIVKKINEKWEVMKQVIPEKIVPIKKESKSLNSLLKCNELENAEYHVSKLNELSNWLYDNDIEEDSLQKTLAVFINFHGVK